MRSAQSMRKMFPPMREHQRIFRHFARPFKSLIGPRLERQGRYRPCPGMSTQTTGALTLAEDLPLAVPLRCVRRRGCAMVNSASSAYTSRGTSCARVHDARADADVIHQPSSGPASMARSSAIVSPSRRICGTGYGNRAESVKVDPKCFCPGDGFRRHRVGNVECAGNCRARSDEWPPSPALVRSRCAGHDALGVIPGTLLHPSLEFRLGGNRCGSTRRLGRFREVADARGARERHRGAGWNWNVSKIYGLNLADSRTVLSGLRQNGNREYRGKKSGQFQSASSHTIITVWFYDCV